MLGLLLIYFIGKRFYDLAGNYNKPQWKWGILSVVTYYGTIIISQILVGFVYYFASPESFDYEGNFITPGTELAIGLATIPLGLLACYLLHRYLEKRWKKEQHIPVEEIDSIGE